MGYLFVTGASGLLGSYLMRDLLRTGTKLAVLVRRTKFESAQQRVDGLLAHWEKQVGFALPRPVVFDGDLSQSDLGLGDSVVDWAKENVTAFLHNAASLPFHSESRDDEPWRSNLTGTRNVLEFCRRAEVREFHHVSTAYVSGLREDRIFENELDVGQKHGNDYEISKFEAEQLVRSADYLDSLTVYRPGIIFGDSVTGYTSTYHGFYVPLKLVSTLIKKTSSLAASREQMAAGVRIAGQRLRNILKLTGNESKNYVPVDWCSAVMTEIFRRPELHGDTYHLTPRKAVSVTVTQQVMEEAFIKYAELTSQAKQTNVNWQEFERVFIEGMEVYRSYWGNDPVFDYTNTERAVPHLPCPALDEALITKMCKFAIESNFGWPRPPTVTPQFDVHEHLNGLQHARNGNGHANGDSVALGLQVNGLGGGQWELKLEHGDIVAASPGISSRSTATYYLNSNTFERLASRQSTVEQAIGSGHVLIEGNGVPLPELARLLQTVADIQRKPPPTN